MDRGFSIQRVYTVLVILHCLSSCFAEELSDLHGSNKKCQGHTEGHLHPNMSVAHLLNGRYASGTAYFEEESQIVPKWVNLTLFKIGQKFAQAHSGVLGLSHVLALIMDNVIPDIKHTLLATGTTANVKNAARRYTATAVQVYVWYDNSLDDPQQKRVFFNSIKQVRRHHYDAVFKMLSKLKEKNFLERYRKERMLSLQRDKQSIFNDYRFWSAFMADIKYSHIPPQQRKYPPYSFTGIPITQFAQVMTQFSFIGLPVLFGTKFGINHVTDEELRGFIHFWGVTGHALGILDEYNICMPASLEETTNLFQEIMDQLVIPSLFELDQTSHLQLSTLMDAIYLIHPTMSPGLLAYYFLRDICLINPVRVRQQLNIFEIMYGAALDGLRSDNLPLNSWLFKINVSFGLDVVGHKYFGGNYTNIERRSKRVFYTREKLIVEE